MPRFFNPDCTSEHRCGACMKDTCSSGQMKAQSRLREKRNYQTRTCVDCKRTFDLATFRTTDGHSYFSSRCRECQLAIRRAKHKMKILGGIKEPKPVRVRRCVDCADVLKKRGATRCFDCYQKWRVMHPTPKPVRPMVKCESCDQMIDAGKKRCLQCTKREREFIAVASEYERRLKKAYNALKREAVFALMIGGVEEVYVLTSKCSICDKPVLEQGLCYACATQRPYTIPIRTRLVYRGDAEVAA